jgi:hypothetical protein
VGRLFLSWVVRFWESWGPILHYGACIQMHAPPNFALKLTARAHLHVVVYICRSARRSLTLIR